MGKVCTYEDIYMSLDTFKSLVNAHRQDAYYLAGLTAVALCNFKVDTDRCIAMLNALRNPAEPMTDRDKNTLIERLTGKEYIPFSYFAGAIQFNNFTPREPYSILVKDNQYSFYSEGWAELWLHSTGSPIDRQVRLRMRPSTGAWYLTEQMLVQDITIVEEEKEEETEDPWG